MESYSDSFCLLQYLYFWKIIFFQISNAFSDVRREVGILSKLKHEFIVTFIGICVRPHLLLIMELAPLGSLRKELEIRISNTHSELNNSDVVVSQMIFSKDLTHKIILQVGIILIDYSHPILCIVTYKFLFCMLLVADSCS